MTLNYVTLICDEGAGQGYFRPGGTATLTPSAVLTDAVDHLVVDLEPVTVTFSPVGPPSVRLLACDDANILPGPGGWTWTFTPPAGSGMTAFSFFLNFAAGATQYLSAQVPVSPAGSFAASAVPGAYIAVSGDTTGATDTALIQALENLGSKTIYFGPGTFWTNGLTKQSKTIWQAAGEQVTTIKLAAGANADVVQGANFGTLTGTGSTGGITAWSIRDLTIDGNRSAQSGPSWGLRVYGYDFKMHNVTVTNCYTDGMYTEWAFLGSPSYGGSNPDSMESLYTGVKSCFNGGWGWHNRGPHDSVAVGCVWFGNNMTAGTAGNLWVEDDRASQHFLGGGLECIGCHTWGNSASWGIIADATLIWSGGAIEGATYGAILVRGNLELSATKVFYNSVAAISSGAGIQLGDDGSTPGVPSSFAFTSNGVRISATGLDNFAGAGRSSAALAWVSCNHSSVDVHCNPQAPTVAAGSNGQAINALTSSQLLVSATTGWPASGTIYVQTSSGYARCTYTSVTGGGTPSFNGVAYVSGTGAASTVATGALVTGDPLGGTSPDQYSTVRVDQGTGTASGIRGALSVQQQPGPAKIITGALTSAWHIQNAVSGDIVNLNTAGATPFLQVVGAILQGFTANYGTLTQKMDPTTGAFQPGTTAGPGAHIYSGTGAPNVPGSVSGDIYLRTDTPGTPNQQLYMATGANTWAAIPTSVADTNAANIQPDGIQSAGANGLWADSGHVHQNNADLSLFIGPTGATGETFPRRLAGSASGALVSGTVYVTAIPLPKGLLISNLTMFTNIAAKTGGSHGWYVLLDSSRVVRAVTADQTDAATVWGAASTPYPLATNAYTTTYAGLYYIGVCIVASGMPSITCSGPALAAGINVATPMLAATSSAAQTTPPITGTTMGVLAGAGNFQFYGYTS
jgi:hypothetical protein